ncbi:hypothetical protein AVEN_26707-1 [Araneus ventricosus]|uniref:Uncharacterized protein n=1 Tax=Araneus ventricosus TaxID=182803 RepID=A0A4Y2UBT4_ARAVE|nr:hypothetical protein AVEN_26707-1 [Araneus ventricosus]
MNCSKRPYNHIVIHNQELIRVLPPLMHPLHSPVGVQGSPVINNCQIFSYLFPVCTPHSFWKNNGKQQTKFPRNISSMKSEVAPAICRQVSRIIQLEGVRMGCREEGGEAVIRIGPYHPPLKRERAPKSLNYN